MNTLENSSIKMERSAIDLFLRLTDLDLSKMMRELQKLVLYGQNQQQITVREVEELVPKTLEHNIFDMTQYILKGKTEQALRLYEDLVMQGKKQSKLMRFCFLNYVYFTDKISCKDWLSAGKYC